MALKVWMDGQLLDKDQAKVSVWDHGLLYGDGVFEGLRMYHGRLFQGETHMRRLFDSAKAIRLKIPYTPKDLCTAVEVTAKANGFADCYVRLVVTRGSGYLGLNPAKCTMPVVFIITDTIEMYPPATYEKGLAVITASVIRNHPNSLSPRIKSLNYLNNILARIEASDAGVSEAIMLNLDGNVAECSADNIFIAREGTIYTPGTADGILEGVTRDVIMKLSAKLGITCIEKTLQRHDLYIADECFLTGTGAEVVPVTKIDSRTIGSGEPGPLTRKITEAFHEFVRQG